MIPTTPDIVQQNFSIIGTESSLNGKFALKGESRIFAHLQGEITMVDQALLTLERSSVVTGKIECHDIEISGSFNGEINATGSMTIHPSARVEGQITSLNLMIAPGAVVNIDAQTAGD
jgi:cytoskeletal protein CcmA (bactofilin family)